MRGSHIGLPVKRGSGISYFDGPPIVSCLGFCVHQGKLTEPVDVFDHPFWDEVRGRAAAKAVEIRRQGFRGAAMLPYSELEYGGSWTSWSGWRSGSASARPPSPSRSPPDRPAGTRGSRLRLR
jgi:fructose 1,6-bisphosphatase